MEEMGFVVNGHEIFYNVEGIDLELSFDQDGIVKRIKIGENTKTPLEISGIKIGTSREYASETLKMQYDVYEGNQDISGTFSWYNLKNGTMITCDYKQGIINTINYSEIPMEKFIQLQNDVEQESNTYEAIQQETTAQNSHALEFKVYDSNTRLLNRDELNLYSDADLRVIRNEIYARHGLIFKSQDLSTHFNSMSWYLGTISDMNQISLSEIERENVNSIVEIESEREIVADAKAFLVGESFWVNGTEINVEFKKDGEFVAYNWYGSSPEIHLYAPYTIWAEHAMHKDSWQPLLYITIDGVPYYFRYFSDNSISLDGSGPFSAWYEMIN